MKKVKRIFAGMAAAVMAFSTMSIGASAYYESIALVANSSAPAYNVISQSWTRVVTKTLQSMNITTFNVPSGSNCKVHLVNGMGIDSYVCSEVNTTKTIPYNALGTNTYISATLVDYSSGKNNVNGYVDG